MGRNDPSLSIFRKSNKQDSLKDAATMAESAQILMNVSEFTDISTATDTLISAMQANDCLYVWKHAYSTHLNPVTPKALLLQCG